MWGVKCPGDSKATPQPIEATPAIRELAVRCAGAFGLELYEIECLFTPSGPQVLGVRSFPDYLGFPHANERLARYVIHRARQSLRDRRLRFSDA